MLMKDASWQVSGRMRNSCRESAKGERAERRERERERERERGLSGEQSDENRNCSPRWLGVKMALRLLIPP